MSKDKSLPIEAQNDDGDKVGMWRRTPQSRCLDVA